MEGQLPQQVVEVRGFGPLRKVFDERNWTFPYFFPLEQACSAYELASLMNLPLEKIEAVFVNGLASPLKDALVKPGDRVGFIPVGVPGPYRVMLGIIKVPDQESQED